jgi:phosphopantothenoylcysteine synthetase/decarboxylase
LNDQFAASFTNVYERKTFILGLTSAFNAEVMPPSMQTHLLKIIQQIIAMLNKLKEQEAKSLQKAAKKEIKASDNDDDDDDDEDGDSDDEDDFEDADEDDHMQEDEEAKHSEPEEDGATGGGGPAESTKNSKWTT